MEFHRFSTHMNTRALSKAFQAIEKQAFLRVIALSRIDFDVNVYMCFLVCMHFSIGCKHHSGFLDLRKESNSSEFKSFLLIMCIDAPASTTNSRSSCLVEVGASITLAQ